MNYVITGNGTPNALDIEHIINSMSKVSLYGKRGYFIKGSIVADVALEAACKWKELNVHSPVELIGIELDEFRSDRPVIDCMMIFIDESLDRNKEFIEFLRLTEAHGIRVEKYVLRTWDKEEQQWNNNMKKLNC